MSPDVTYCGKCREAALLMGDPPLWTCTNPDCAHTWEPPLIDPATGRQPEEPAA